MARFDIRGCARRFALAILFVTLGARITAAEPPLRVAYAGSMGAVMDQQIGPAFAKAHNVGYQGIGQASYALAHLLASKQLQADVFVPVTPGPMRILLEKGMVQHAAPIASTQMAVVYGPKSSFAGKFQQAAHGQAPWYKVLEEPGLRFGRTDPATDPQGRNVIFTMMLAETYYHQPGLAKILGPLRNPAQIFAEPSLLARLESGQLDASIGYLSAIKSQRLPYIELPAEINLGNADDTQTYDKVSFATTDKSGNPIMAKPEPLVFYAAVLSDAAHPAPAAEFVEFLTGAQGQRFFRDAGYDPPSGGALQ